MSSIYKYCQVLSGLRGSGVGIREGAGRVKGVDNLLTIRALVININPSNGSGKLKILFCQSTAHNLNVKL